MRSRSRGPRISSARPADQTAQVSTRPSRRRRARVSRRLAPRGLVRTPASFRRDISSCTSGAPSNSRGNCAPAAVDDASGSASSLRPKPCRPAPTAIRLGPDRRLNRVLQPPREKRADRLSIRGDGQAVLMNRGVLGSAGRRLRPGWPRKTSSAAVGRSGSRRRSRRPSGRRSVADKSIPHCVHVWSYDPPALRSRRSCRVSEGLHLARRV